MYINILKILYLWKFNTELWIGEITPGLLSKSLEVRFNDFTPVNNEEMGVQMMYNSKHNVNNRALKIKGTFWMFLEWFLF